MGDAVPLVYISIGNSDDRLTQSEWSAFWRETDYAIRTRARTMHGSWASPTTAAYQNACWCAEVAQVDALRASLLALAQEFRQESITWAEVPSVEFLRAPTKEARGG